MVLARILVDGYSLLHNWPELAPGAARHSARAREELVHVLTRYHDATGEPITVYDHGTLRRDFTYIDDIVAGVLGVLDQPPDGTPPARLLNIGNNHSEPVSALIALLEEGLGRRAVLHHAPRPAADVPETAADIEAIHALTGFTPSTPLAVGIPHFVEWFKEWQARRG